jgi:hypothetical protein
MRSAGLRVLRAAFSTARAHTHALFRSERQSFLRLFGDIRDNGGPLGQKTEIPPHCSTLPRLESRVRIPSPAPNFLKEMIGLERSFGAVFCFPDLDDETGEAWGKQQNACCSGPADASGMGMAPKPTNSTGSGARLNSPQVVSAAQVSLLPRSSRPPRICFPGSCDDGKGVIVQIPGQLDAWA